MLKLKEVYNNGNALLVLRYMDIHDSKFAAEDIPQYSTCTKKELKRHYKPFLNDLSVSYSRKYLLKILKEGEKR